jgi:hypothetical protein
MPAVGSTYTHSCQATEVREEDGPPTKAAVLFYWGLDGQPFIQGPLIKSSDEDLPQDTLQEESSAKDEYA